MTKLLRRIWTVIVGAAPWIIKGVVFLLKLMTLGAVSIIKGVPEATDEIANDWLNEARTRDNRILSQYEKYVYWTTRLLAVIFVLLGWICLAFSTVFLIMLLF